MVLAVRREWRGAVELDVTTSEGTIRALAYPELTGRPQAGDRLLLNTSALTLGLGTGGYALVVALPDRLPADLTAGAQFLSVTIDGVSRLSNVSLTGFVSGTPSYFGFAGGTGGATDAVRNASRTSSPPGAVSEYSWASVMTRQVTKAAELTGQFYRALEDRNYFHGASPTMAEVMSGLVRLFM